LAAAINDDSNFAGSITSSLSTKLNIANFDSSFDTRLETKSTSDISEGTNLYFTDERVDDRVANLITGANGIRVLYNDSSNSLQISVDSAPEVGYDLSANTTDDLSEGSTNLYYTKARVDSDVNQGFADRTTTNLTEGDNLYYTTSRADSDFDTRLGTKSTTNLAEGDNLYYTTARVDSDVEQGFNDRTTSDLTEGSNLYYTTNRADSDTSAYLITNGYATENYVDSNITTAVNNLIDGAPGVLDTLNELAAAINDDSNFAGTVTAALATKFNSADFNSTFDTRLGTKSTTDLVEGNNLYYTTARFDSDFGDNTTSDLSEGSNLYYTKARVDSDVAQGFTDRTTTDLAEGDNLYYTTARADSDAKNAISVTDNGGDGSLTYTPSTGVINYTGPSASEVRSHFSAAGDLTYDSATGKFSFNVEQVYTKANFDSDLGDASTDDLPEGLTNLYYTKVRVDSDVNQGFEDRTTSDLAEGTNLYYTTARFDSDFSDNTTTDLTEGGNLYYTKARVDSDFDTRLATKSTTDISEGNNLYYTKVRVDSDVEQGFNDRTTDTLDEGSTNLYYTSARADSDAKNAISVTDNGGDGSLTYTPATGVIAYTGPSAAEARAHFSVGANGLSYNSSTGVFNIDSAGSIITSTLNVVNNLVVDGNLQVNGTTTTVSTQNLEVTDNMIYLNASESAGSPTQFIDVGWAANVNDTGTYAHTGVFRDATDGVYKIYQGYIPEPDSDVDIDTNHASFAFAPLQVASITADTLTGVYQGFDSDFNDKSTSDLSEGTNLYYTTVRFDSDFGDNTTSDLTEGSNLYYTTTRADSDFDVRLATKSTDNLTEGSNLYYTTVRADSDFDVRLATKSTTDLAEGDNLYYTKVRVDSDVNQGFADRTTTDLAEGDNLYYTTAKADSDAKNAISVTDNGGDGSLSYNNATGVISYTGPSASEVRAHFSAGGDLSYDSATGKFSFDAEQVYTKANFDSDLGDANTGQLSEGSNLYYTKVRVDSDVNQGFEDRTTTDLAEGDNLYYTNVRADSDFDIRLATKSTTDLAEGVNLYYTTARADSDFDIRLATKTTDNLSEGSINIYYTTARHDSDFAVSLAGSTTSDLSEGANLYYTKVRTDSDIQSYLVSNSYVTETYVDSNITVAINNLVDGAPGALDTLNELAEALNDDSNFANTVTESLATKFNSADFNSTFDTQFGLKSTDSLSEGLTNLYYTVSRVDSDILDLVDSNYVQNRQDFAYSSLAGAPTNVSSFNNDANYLDSSAATGIIDEHLNLSSAGTDQVLSYDGNDYTWIDAASGTSSGLTELSDSTSGTSQQIIDTYNGSTHRSADYHLQISSNDGFGVIKALVYHDNNDAYISSYVSVGNNLGTFAVELNDSDVNLLFTPTTSSTIVNFTRSLITNNNEFNPLILPQDLETGEGSIDLQTSTSGEKDLNA